MFAHAWPAIALSIVAAVSLVLGSALPALRTRILEHRLTLLIGFSAGLMLATALHELLPEAFKFAGESGLWGAGLGFIVLYVAERITHFHACRHRQCDVEHGPDVVLPDLSPHREPLAVLPMVAQPPAAPAHPHSHPHAHTGSMAMVGMSIHNFADGLTAAAAFMLSPAIGLVVVFAIVLHQMAAGLSLGAILLRTGKQRRGVLMNTTAVASFIVWGSLFYLLVLPVGQHLQGIILGIAAGSFLYVAACDLLPEAHLDDEGWSVTATTVIGYIFAAGIKFLFGG